MKKIIILFMVVLSLLSISACGENKNSADSYADRLARGEITPDAEIAEDASKGTSKKKKETNDEEKENQEAQKQTSETNKEESVEAEKVTEKENNASVNNEPKITLSLSEAQMGEMIDKFDDEYKSFEVIQIQSPDFFMKKNLRLGAVIADHKLSQVYNQNIKAVFSQEKMKIFSVNAAGEEVSSEYFMYLTSQNVAKTPAGRDFVYISYGSDVPNGGEINGVIGIMARVVSSKPEAMGEAKADEYILLIESGQPEVYQLFLAE